MTDKPMDTTGLRALLAAYLQHPSYNESRALGLSDALEKVGVKLIDLERGPATEEWKIVAPVLDEFLGVNKVHELTRDGTMRMIAAHDSSLKWISPIGIRSLNIWGSHRDYDPQDPIARVVTDDGQVHAVKVRELAASSIQIPRHQ